MDRNSNLSSPDVSSFLTPPISPEDFSNFSRCVNGNNVNPVIQPDHHFDDQMNVLQPSVNHIAEPIQNALNIPVIASASNGLVYDNQALYYTDAVLSRQQQQQQQLARVEIYQPNNGDDTIDDSSLVTVAYVISPSRQEQLVAEQCLVQYVTQTAPSVEPHANAIREPQMRDFHNDVNINRETLIESSHSNIIQGDESQIDENQADESNSTATLYRGECQYNWSMQPHQYYRGGQGKPWRHMLNLERATREQRFYDRRLNRSFARGGLKKIDIEDETMQTEDKTTEERMMVPEEMTADQKENMEVQQNENMEIQKNENTQADSNDIEAEKIETEKMEKIEAEQEKLEIENKKMETAKKKKIETEKKKMEAEKRKKKSEQKRKESENKRKMEAEQKKKEAEEKREMEAEKRRIESEKRKIEAEKRKMESGRKKKMLAETKRLENEEKKLAAEKKKKLEADLKKQRDIQTKLAAEKRKLEEKYAMELKKFQKNY
ncbi:hypothetical protein QAD02_023750 [Eretmocerus hayati]|uniref:Uncharacterized protein n=1 Tax=Eretmocerus hayati TaxID=131215 RepID=A0ACC2PWJ1_9HYME|nr:hypothetical protein QAD02_023750 [Eretmocerus hayati]